MDFFFLLVIFLAFIIPLITLMDILTHEFTGSNKLVRVLVVLFYPFLGAVLYYFIGRGQKIGSSGRRF